MTAPLGLVVDDDRHVRSFFAKVLRRGGMDILEASSGWEALLVAQTSRPAFVVTDLQMRDLDGLELCRRLKTTESTASIPVIAVTGAAREGDVELARAAGFDRVLIKPCLPDALRDTIHDLLARSARARDTSTQAAARSTRLRNRTSSLAVKSRVLQCRTAAMAGQATTFPCPDCGSGLVWRDTQTVAGIQFDYFAPCENRCGQYYFDHQRRRFMRLR